MSWFNTKYKRKVMRMLKKSETMSLFTSEAVGRGHPDKLCDQISDAILDRCLKADPLARVAIETLLKGDSESTTAVLAGEISIVEGKEIMQEELEQIVRQTCINVGYDDWDFGLDAGDEDRFTILNLITSQSLDIGQGVDEGGAGDQGLMFGYATNESLYLEKAELELKNSLMPVSHQLANGLVEHFSTVVRLSPHHEWMGPDIKSQVTMVYDETGKPDHIDTIVMAVQHRESIESSSVQNIVTNDIRAYLSQVLGMLPHRFADTQIIVNGTGRFVNGGPAADAGLTGRKIIVDTYGGAGRHGGGAFSGKDPSKVDRSAAYAARWAAKHVVAAGLASRCEIQLAYVIGVAEPVSISIHTFGTGCLPDQELQDLVETHFNFEPTAIIEALNLRKPIYGATACGGHFGRQPHKNNTGQFFSWEILDATLLQQLACGARLKLLCDA